MMEPLRIGWHLNPAAALARQIRSAEEQLARLARERDRGPSGSSFMSGLSINPWG